MEGLRGAHGRVGRVRRHGCRPAGLPSVSGLEPSRFAGALPAWLAPLQAVVASITEAHAGYAGAVAKALQKQGLRVEADLRNEKINYKIREHSVQKLPYQIVIGEKEKAAGLVAVRARGGQDLGQMSLDSLIERWRREVEAKAGTV